MWSSTWKGPAACRHFARYLSQIGIDFSPLCIILELSKSSKIGLPVIQGGAAGLNTGKGEKLSYSQSSSSLALCWFLSLSGIKFYGPTLYISLSEEALGLVSLPKLSPKNLKSTKRKIHESPLLHCLALLGCNLVSLYFRCWILRSHPVLLMKEMGCQKRASEGSKSFCTYRDPTSKGVTGGESCGMWLMIYKMAEPIWRNFQGILRLPPASLFNDWGSIAKSAEVGYETG